MPRSLSVLALYAEKEPWGTDSVVITAALRYCDEIGLTARDLLLASGGVSIRAALRKRGFRKQGMPAGLSVNRDADDQLSEMMRRLPHSIGRAL